MKDWKNMCRRFFYPPIWLILLLTVISTVALVAVFVKGWDTSPMAYVVYMLSFYSLTVICIACYKTFPGYYKRIKGKVYENKYANRYITDAAFKTHITLYRSLTVNLLYAATNAVSAIIYSTNWFAIFAVYYAIMAVMRFLLVRYVNRKGID